MPKPRPVYGQHATAPRITPVALRIALARVALPLIAALLLFDLAVWWVARWLWGVCAAVWCLF